MPPTEKLIIDPSPSSSSHSNTQPLPLPPHSDPYDSDSNTILTPTESTVSSPHYDDLPPPSYDEAQRDASRGVGEIRSDDDVGAGGTTRYTGVANIAVGYVGGSERIAVGRMGFPEEKARGAGEVGGDLERDRERMGEVLGVALEFATAEGGWDGCGGMRRLERCVAVPRVVLGGMVGEAVGKGKGKGKEKETAEMERKRERKECRKERRGEGRESASAEFLRAYSQSLAVRSVPAPVFIDFIDGLNTLCTVSPLGVDSEVVCRYIETANDIFFAPRGLRVSIQRLPSLLDIAGVPTDRGQRDMIMQSVTGGEDSAKALVPWIERLEVSNEGISRNASMLRAMVDQFRHDASTGGNNTAREPMNPTLERDDDDPPHSLPQDFPQGNGRSGGCHGRRGHGRGGFEHRGAHHGYQNHAWGPFGALGNGPFGPPGHGPFGAPGNGPFGAAGSGPFGSGYGGGPFNRGFRHGSGCGPAAGDHGNEWAAWGQNMGKWGEEFGKRMGDWGEQFGRRAGEWGEDFGRRAGEWGNDVGRRAGGFSGQAVAAGSQVHAQNGVGLGGWSGGQGEQTSGMVGEKSRDVEAERGVGEKSAKLKDDDYDDDYDDSSSTSSSDSDFDLDSSSDSDDEDCDPEKAFLERLQIINATANAALEKGKQDPVVIENDRAIAIEKAQKQRTKWQAKREIHAKKREVKRDWIRKRREFRRLGLKKKSKEWKDGKKAYKDSKKVLRKEKKGIRKECREKNKEKRKGRRVVDGASRGFVGARGVEEMVWVVVENLE